MHPDMTPKHTTQTETEDKATAVDRPTCPEEGASWFSRLFLGWVFSMVYTGWKKPLEEEQLWQLRDFESGEQTTSLLLTTLQARMESQTGSKKGHIEGLLQGSLLRAFKSVFLFGFILKTMDIAAYVLMPIVLNKIIRILQQPEDPPVRDIIGWPLALFSLSLFKAIGETHYFAFTMRGGLRVRSSIQGALYEKSLRISPAARASSSVGEIVNLMQLDSQRIGDFVMQSHTLYAAPIQVLVSAVLLYIYIGRAAIIGLVFTILTAPIQGMLMLIQIKLRKANFGITDKRVKLMNEILQGIKAVKFYGWEQPFSRCVSEFRAQELKKRLQTLWVRSTIIAIMISLPTLVAVVTFSFYVAVFKGTLNAARIFTGLAILTQLRMPIMMLPMVFTMLIDTRLGIKRIERFLDLEDTDNFARTKSITSTTSTSEDDISLTSPSNLQSKPPLAPSISISGGEFEWSKIEQNPLKTPEKKARRSCLPRRKKNNNTETENGTPENDGSGDSGTQGTGDSAQGNLKSYVSLRGSVLRDVNIRFEAGKLSAIVGFVGSGKSSLFHAILGEMRRVKGEVSLIGSVAYVPQTAWIFNGTLRENITFGKKFEEELYKQAIMASGLEMDISILPAGDLTAIGEKGINLSGGQKQRVSLARALYSEADVYLFDDPLSALDSHVGQHVFEHCVSNQGLLRDKLRVLVTNQMHLLSDCDNIVVLESGMVRCQGTLNELAGDDVFKLLVSEQHKDSGESKEEDMIQDGDEEATSSDSAKQGNNKMDGKGENTEKDSAMSARAKAAGKNLMADEERTTGNVVFWTYYDYVNALGGVFPIFVLLVFALVVSSGSFVAQWWLSFWVGEENGENKAGRTIPFYLAIYFSLAVVYALLSFTRSVLFAWTNFRASKQMHEDMLKSVLHAPMTFFDTTPIGRLLSRFSRDMSAVDDQLQQFIEQATNSVFLVLLTYSFIGIILPPFFALAVPVTIFYVLLQRFFVKTSVELKRLDSISKSPIYAHFSETLGGLSTLRAYGKQEQSRMENMKRIDLNQRAYFAWIMATRWFSLYLESTGSLLVFATALFGIMRRSQGVENIALVLTYAVSVTAFLSFSVRSINELEGQMNSVERVFYYGRNLPQEAASEVKDVLPDVWPSSGEIEFQGVELRYRDDLPLVLKGLNLTVKGGEKVGIVGRTGSGKSSMMIALLRMIELCGGRIVIDGIDLRAIGLNDVRRKITIIPQDPVMFSGTIRFNLDPFGEFSDADLWSALEKSHLKQFVSEFETGLDAPVSEYGENLSAGQRQIICLTRALLRNSKILILDEASSSLDMETDRLIQETIRTHLKDATILTIAHRLFTLADYDKIAVLEDGAIMEYGSPSELLQLSDGRLNFLVGSMGTTGAAQFRRKVSSALTE